jgi:hypothetical protein
MLKSLLLAGVLAFASGCFAQSNEVAVSFGGVFSPSVKQLCEALVTCPATPSDRSIAPAFAIAGEVSHRLVNLHLASLHLELPAMSVPSRPAPSQGGFNSNFSSFFFTPSLKLKLSAAGISPFVSVGGGLAHFSEDSVGDNRGAFQVGGGLDFKTPLPLLGLRFEVRDFMTGRPGTPSFSAVTSDRLHTVFAGAGVTLHF